MLTTKGGRVGTHRGPDGSGLMELRRLTATEARLATLVADGRSDSEIALGLSLPPDAVAEILSAIYAKLGVRSRTELGLLLGRAEIVAGRKSDAGSRRKR